MIFIKSTVLCDATYRNIWSTALATSSTPSSGFRLAEPKSTRTNANRSTRLRRTGQQASVAPGVRISLRSAANSSRKSHCRSWYTVSSYLFQNHAGLRIRIDLMRIRIRIRFQHWVWWPKIENIYSWKFILIFLIKSCNLLIPRPPKRTPKLQEKPSALTGEHPAIQNMKILYFFLFLWVIFALLDPDPDPATQINADLQPCQNDVLSWQRGCIKISK